MSRFIILREILRDVVVPITVAALTAYATIKAAVATQQEEMGDVKIDSYNQFSRICCCGCVCKRSKHQDSEA